MTTGVIQGRDELAQSFRPNGDPPPYAHGNWDIDFIKGNVQSLTVPVQAARPDAIVVFTALDMAATALSHGPTPSGFAIQGHIEGTEILRWRNTTTEFSCQGVIRREHTPNKRNDGQAMLSVVAQCVDIPPEISTRRDRLVESRSAISVAAASRPDMAAIGTPGPGCTLPPARYRPGTGLRAE